PSESQPESDNMAFKLTIPQTGKQHLDITINIGDCLFVLGANGSGKSNLMLHFSTTHPDIRRMLAHRQTWFHTDAVAMTPENKRAYQNNIQEQDRQPNSRWREDYSNERAGIAVYDLIEAESLRARRIAAAVDAKNIEQAIKESGTDSPTKIINELF